jgi:pimeloyl-ACP methyl ester carboxylesterase
MRGSGLRLERLLAEWLALARPSPFPVFDPETRLPRGDGHAVLVLPASLRSDRQTVHLRTFLGELGYTPCGWGLGVNLGPTARVIDGIGARLAQLASLHGAVSLVGFSMGGLFARLLACRHPQQVRQVITVCSPIVAPARSVGIPLEPFLGLWPGVDLRALSAEIAAPLTVASTCIYSRDDGIVRWEHCRDPWTPECDNLEVRGCHVTMPHNRQVLDVLVARLARPHGARGPDR